MSSRMVLGLLAVVMVAEFLVACSRPASNGAGAVFTPKSVVMSDVPATTSAGNATVAVLESLDPCGLLTAQEVGPVVVKSN